MYLCALLFRWIWNFLFYIRENFMFKKTLLFFLLLSTASVSFAKLASDATLTVVPNQPSEWGYIGAIVLVNNQSNDVDQGVTLPVSQHDVVTLTRVAAMNAGPIIDASCQNLV